MDMVLLMESFMELCRWRMTMFQVCLGLLFITPVWMACGTEGQTCKTNEDCGAGFFCRSDGQCRSGCQLSIECPVGKVCLGNECVDVQKDEDQDGFPSPLDCADDDRLVNPGVNEICGNKKDDNCDGQIDEEGCVQIDCRPGDTQECYQGKESTLTFPGTRCRKGQQTCTSSGVWGECQGQVLPAPEICDNEDNDCNGKVDDSDGKDLTRQCYSGPSSTREQGECKAGTQTCSKGQWSECKGEVKPATETCSGKDDDCDGQVDNVKGVGDDCDTGDKGICQAGRKACDAASKKVVCKALQTAEGNETCGDEKDNDCDGFVDEQCPKLPAKVADAASFPHDVALTATHAAVSVKQTKRVLIYDLAVYPPKERHSVSLTNEPYGIQLDATNAYVTTSKEIVQIDLSTGQTTTLYTSPKASIDSQLLLFGGRLYVRGVEDDGQGQLTLSVCSVELATKQANCGSFAGTFQKVGRGIALFGAYALILSDKGIEWINALTLKEDGQQTTLTLPGASDEIAVDDKLKQAVVTSETTNRVYIVALDQSKLLATLEVKNGEGKTEIPGHVAIADGNAWIGHRNSRYVTIMSIAQQTMVDQSEICIAPHGLALGPADPKLGRALWVTCPGDNTIWSVWTGP